MHRRTAYTTLSVLLSASAFALVLQTGVAVSAAEAELRQITLAETLELADAQSLDLQRAGASARIAAGQALEAMLRWVPELELSTGFSTTDGQVQGSFGAFKDVDFQSARPFGRVSYAVNPAEQFFGSRAASDRAALAGAHQRATRTIVLANAARLYYSLAVAQVALEVTRRGRTDTYELKDLAEVLVRQGLGHGDDVERARAEAATADQHVVSAEASLARASIDLAVALDLDPAQRIALRQVPPEQLALAIDTDDETGLVTRALRSRPELTVAENFLAASRKDHRASLARVATPTLEAFYQEGSTGPNYDSLNGLKQYGVLASWTLSASRLAAVETTSRRVDDAELAARAAERRVSADVVAAIALVRAARARLEPAIRTRDATEEALRITRVRFKNGHSLALEVIEAQKAVDRARLGTIESVVGYSQAQLTLRASLGAVEPSDLQTKTR